MRKLTVLLNKDCTLPDWNLAFEELLLKDGKEYGDIFMLWRNSPSVIIGKNQNAYREINKSFLEKENISLIRRITGGGAVFHDLGNINFTFIGDTDSKELNFSNYAMPIVNAIRSLGVNAELNGRNDICVDNKKISGTAQCIENGRVMQHGTLLYNVDIGKLSGALNVNEQKLKDKSIKSVKSRVINLKSLINCNFSAWEFAEFIADFYAKNSKYDKIDIKYIDPRNFTEAEKLVKDKYSTFLWNFGKSPEFEFTNYIRFHFGGVEIALTSKDGIIEKIKIFGDFFSARDIKELESAFVGAMLKKSELLKVISNYNVSDYIMGCTESDLIELFEF